MSKSLEEKIKQIRVDQQDDDDSEIQPEDYENLVLDEINVERLTADDKKYLETFVNLDTLACN